MQAVDASVRRRILPTRPQPDKKQAKRIDIA